MDKKIRRCLSLLLVAAMVVTGLDFVPAKAAETTYTSGDYTYTLNGDDEATITKYDGSASYVAIPSTLDGKQVVGIGDGVFQDKKTITGVNIPEGIKSIGKYALAGTGITSLKLPSSLTAIGAKMLSQNKGVTEIIIPKNVIESTNTYWGGPFEGSNISKVVLEEGMKKIPSEMFRNMDKLTQVDIPDSITKIEESAFNTCSALTDIDIPESVTYIGKYALAGTSIKALKLPSSLQTIGAKVLSGNKEVVEIVIPKTVIESADTYWGGPFEGSNISKVVLEEGMKKIPSEMFRNMDKLTQVDIPDSITAIGGSAFKSCSALTNINIPDAITSIEESTFCECSSLKEINIPDNVTSIGKYAFAKTNIKTLKLPAQLTEIGAKVLSENKEVTEIIVPKTVIKAIDTFWGTPFEGSNIRKVVLEKGMKKIPANLLKNMEKLTQVNIPNSIVLIEESAFSSCSSLTSINIPDSVTTIGKYAFSETSLAALKLPSSLKTIGAKILSGNKGVMEIVIPKNITEVTDTYWGEPFEGSGISKVTFEKGLKKIPSHLFHNASQLREVKLLDEMTDIDSYAFENCTNLRSVELPISIKTIGDGAFSGCTSLTEVLANKKITSIGKNAFQNCTNATIKVAKYTDSMKSFTDAEQNLEFSNLEYTDTVDKVIEHEKSTYEINGSSASSYVVMNLDYALKQKEIKNVKDMQLVVKLPATSAVNSIKLDGIALSDSDFKITSDNKITIPVKKSTGKCRIYTTPNVDGRINSYAVLNYEKDGVSQSNIIGAVSENCTCLTLGCNDDVSYEKGEDSVSVEVKGYGISGKNVEIYVDGELVKEVLVSKTGKYSTDIALDYPENFKNYTVKIVSVEKSGKEAELSKQITTIENGPKLSGVSLYIEAHDYKDGHKTFDLLKNDGTLKYITFQAGKPYQFSIQYENADKISRVFVISSRGGYSRKLEAKWDADKNAYVTNGFFGNDASYVPGNLSIEYVAKPDGGTQVDEEENVTLTDEEKASIPENWREATAEQITDTESDYQAEITLKSGDVVEYSYDKMTLTEYAEELEKKQAAQSGEEDTELNACSDLSEGVGDIIDFLKVFDKEGTAKDIGKLYDFFEKDGFSRYTMGEGDLAQDIALVKTELNADTIQMYLVDPKAVDNTVARYIIKKGQSTTQKTIFDLFGMDSSTGGFLVDSANSMFSFEGNVINLLWMKQEVMSDQSLSPAQREAKLKEIQKMADIAAEKMVFTYIAGVIGVFGAMALPGSGVAIACGLLALAIKKCIIPMIESGDFDDFLNGKLSLKDMIIRWIIDPSGYVYEGVMTNRLSDVTTTLYYKEKKTDKKGTVWDASEYDQENPLVTDEAGSYAWDVPEGYWQVKAEKEGYETAYSDWMEVPPPQTDVNIEMKPLAAPEIKEIHSYETFTKVIFTQYMDPETVKNLTLTDSQGNSIAYTLSYDKSETDAARNVFAKEFTLIYDTPIAKGEKVTVGGMENITSSTGKALAAVTKSDVASEDVTIESNDYVNLALEDSYELSVEVSGASKGSLAASIDNSQVAEITKIEEGDDGIYKISMKGLVYGQAVLSLTVKETGISKKVNIQVGEETSSGKNIYDEDPIQMVKLDLTKISGKMESDINVNADAEGVILPFTKKYQRVFFEIPEDINLAQISDIIIKANVPGELSLAVFNNTFDKSSNEWWNDDVWTVYPFFEGSYPDRKENGSHGSTLGDETQTFLFNVDTDKLSRLTGNGGYLTIGANADPVTGAAYTDVTYKIYSIQLVVNKTVEPIGGGEDPQPTVTPTTEPQPTAVPTTEPQPTAVPTTEPQPTAVPTTKPQPTAVPTTKPQPTVVPTAKPQPTVVPTTKPQPTVVPTTKPQPTAGPTQKPQSTVKPQQPQAPNTSTGTPAGNNNSSNANTGANNSSSGSSNISGGSYGNAGNATTVPKITMWKITQKGKGKVKVIWKKVVGSSGYQVQYSLNKKMRAAKLKNCKAASLTIKKLKKKKTYYVRVRAYKMVNGRKVYGKWSGVKKVKIKK